MAKRNASGNASAGAKVAISILSAGAGIAGGILLGRSRNGHSKTLGVPVPTRRRVDLRGLAENVGEAGRQFAKLAAEVRAVRQKAEAVSKVIAP